MTHNRVVSVEYKAPVDSSFFLALHHVDTSIKRSLILTAFFMLPFFMLSSDVPMGVHLALVKSFQPGIVRLLSFDNPMLDRNHSYLKRTA